MIQLPRQIKRIIFILITLSLTVGLALLWRNELKPISFTGSMDIIVLSNNSGCKEALTVTAFLLSGNSVMPSSADNRYRFVEKYTPYVSIAIELPENKCESNTQLIIYYRGKTFHYTSREIFRWERIINNNKKMYLIPAEVSKLTGFADKNISLLYAWLLDCYGLGLHRYVSLIMALLVILFLGFFIPEYIIKSGSGPEKMNQRTNILRGMRFFKWLIAGFLIMASAIHLLLIFFGVTIITTGPVLMAAIFIVFLILIRFILKNRPGIRNNLTLFFSVFFFCVLTAEIILRLSGITSTYLEKRNGGFYQSPYTKQETGWYHLWKPNAVHYLKTGEYNYIRQTNSLGLSDKEIPLRKTNGEFRIIGLGDSFTECDGADQDSSWLKDLERSFRKHFPERNISLYNAGVCGSDPFFEYVLLRDKLIRYKPDLVILALNNEAADIMVRGGMERFLSDGTCKYKSPPDWEPVYAYSHIFRLILHRLLHYNSFLMKPDEAKKEEEKAIRLFINSIVLFNQLAHKNSFSLLVVLHPNIDEVKKHQFDYLNRIVNSCKSMNIDCLDMLDYYNHKEHIGKNNAPLYFWKNDGHHNARGYAAFARGVEWKLREMGIPTEQK